MGKLLVVQVIIWTNPIPNCSSFSKLKELENAVTTWHNGLMAKKKKKKKENFEAHEQVR